MREPTSPHRSCRRGLVGKRFDPGRTVQRDVLWAARPNASSECCTERLSCIRRHVVHSDRHAGQAPRRRECSRPSGTADRSALRGRGQASRRTAAAHRDSRRSSSARSPWRIGMKCSVARMSPSAPCADHRKLLTIRSYGRTNRGSPRRCGRQSDVDDQQPHQGAWGRKGPRETRPRTWRTQQEVLEQLGFSRREIDGLRASGATPKAKSVWRTLDIVGLFRRSATFIRSRHGKRHARHRKLTMDEIVAERSGSILRVELNRPAKKNAMTSRHV